MGYIIDAIKLLKKENKNLKFGLIYSFNKKKSNLEIDNLIYLKKNKIGQKNFFINFEEKLTTTSLDKKYLEYFEKISNINIWKIISADRIYGRVYINDIDSYRSNFSKKNYEKILINFIYVAKRIEKIFLKFKPTTIFISSGQSNIEASIMNVFAKYYKVKILVPHPSFYKNYIYFSDDIYTFKAKKVEQTFYNQQIEKKDYKKYNLLLNEIKNKGVVSQDREIVRRKIALLFKKNLANKILGNFIYISLKHIFFKTLFSFNIKLYHLKFLSSYSLFLNIRDELYLKKMLKFLLLLKFPDLKKNYVYVPLHLMPETTSLLNGNDYMNQAFVIETISKNIPSNYKLYVKEHPAMFTSHARKIDFYNRISLLPNVELVPIYADGVKLIQNSKLVISIDGSSNFEAMLMRKPALYLKFFRYSFLNLTVTNSNLNILNLDIKKAINKVKKLKKFEFESKIRKLIYAIVNSCYILRKPGVFFYNDKKFSLLDQKICGEDLASAILKELKIKKKM